MRVLHERPKVTDAPPAEADVLIEEARRRQRRRWRVGTALVVMALVGVSLAYVAGGFGGNGPKAASLGSAHPGGPAVGQSSSKGSVPAISEAGVMPASEISVDDGLIAVMSGSGASCSTKLLNPRSLQAVRSVDSCPAQGTKDDVVASLGRFNLQQIRVMATNPKTGQKSLGPLVLSVQAWDWNHSTVAEGNGAVWIYGLAESSGPSPLLEVSTATGRVLHRFSVAAGGDPYLFVDDDGAWITPSAWGGSSCTGSCTLWHVAPGSDRLVAVRQLGVRTQWLMDSGHSIYADVLTGVAGEWLQTIWRLDGPDATVAYKTQATLLPSTDFTLQTGYVVLGNAQQGYFTLSENGTSTIPPAIGDCDTSAPIRVVRIDPATGKQSYVGAIPRSIAGAQLDCHLGENQGVYYDGAFYALAADSGDLIADYQRVVRVET